jgi:hypothetical protein
MELAKQPVEIGTFSSGRFNSVLITFFLNWQWFLLSPSKQKNISHGVYLFGL